MSSSPAVEPSSPSTTPSSPALRADCLQFHTSTPNFIGGRKHHQPPLNVILPATAPATPPTYSEATVTPPPRSPGAGVVTPASGDARSHPPDGTSSDKSSETAVGTVSRTTTQLSRKESYKAQRQHYRREKKRAASALLHSIEDPSVVVLADWLKVRGSLKSWTKLWCVLKPGLLLLYKTPKAKSSHWVGTVLLTSCQVIERPSKKDGFCFKLYHPLEQSIWAPRGPHNETIGAVVQPLPTAHLIFRAPSQAAGHCWLDGLELALRCSNAMLRCSRSRPEQTVAAEAPATETNISHEELEKHFNEHGVKLSDPSSCSSPLMSISDYSPQYSKTTHQTTKPKRKLSKWAQFVESIEMMSKNDSSDSDSEKKEGFLDFLRKRDIFERNVATTSSVKELPLQKNKKLASKSLASSPMRIELEKRSPIGCFELPKLQSIEKRKEKSSPTVLIEENLLKFMATFPKRRSSTPSTKFLTQKRISELRESGVKTDSENDEVFLKAKLPKRKRVEGSVVLCGTPDNIVITKTAPSLETFRKYSSSTSDDACEIEYRRPKLQKTMELHESEVYFATKMKKSPKQERRRSSIFSLLKRQKKLTRQFSEPAPFTCLSLDRKFSVDSAILSDFMKVENGYKVTLDSCKREVLSSNGELAGAASDTDSEASRGGMTPTRPPPPPKEIVLARIEVYYVEDPDRDVGVAGELVEEVGEENKSLLWFLLKQVRPGMDLSKVVLPTFILEPRSFLDKLADSYYHADILSQAQSLDDPYLRFKLVLRWYLSGLYRKPKGLKKPYNPVLGETFRCCWKHNAETHTYYVAEQVSHHPPVSAFYVSNRKDGYVIEGSLLARSKFYGNSTSAILEGCARIHLLQWGETYVTTAPYAHCKGIVIGTLSMELGGKVHIVCSETGYQADIEFKLRSFLSSSDQTNAISGRIKKGKETVATLDGYWDGKIDIKDKKTGEETNLLDVAVLKDQRMPRYLVRLDRQQEFESQRLWSKVSEAIGNDDQIAATAEKTIIEEAQRHRAKNLVSPWMPRLFHRDVQSNPPEGVIDQAWRYNHINTSPWQPEELVEYEDDFIIKSLKEGSGTVAPPSPLGRERRASDSDTHEELAPRAKATTESKTNLKKQHFMIMEDPVASPSRDHLPRVESEMRGFGTVRTLKQTLYAIDTAIRDQTQAIERLNKNVEAISEGQRNAVNYRAQNVGRAPATSHSWDLFGGFVLALVLQALLNWLFYHKD